jgi:competence protein ComEC
VINVEPNHQIIYCQKTLNFRIGRLQLTINDVDENWYVSNHQDSNNLSPFITINWYNYNVLLTGDCLSDKEQLLISTIQCPVDLYIMGHHGSSSSSSLDLLDKIRPQFVFYSSSDPTGTRYGHPNVNALARIKQYTKYIVGTEYNHHIEFNLTNDQAINSLILTTTG